MSQHCCESTMKEEAKYFFVASAIDDKTWDSFVTRESSAKMLK